MLQEFAIEPTVLDSWLRYDYFMADCGVEKGRLVAEFPAAQWAKHVWKAVSGNPKRTPKDEQKILYHLQHTAEAKLVYTARQYHFPVKCTLLVGSSRSRTYRQKIPADHFLCNSRMESLMLFMQKNSTNMMSLRGRWTPRARLSARPMLLLDSPDCFAPARTW